MGFFIRQRGKLMEQSLPLNALMLVLRSTMLIMIATVLTEALQAGIGSDSLVSASIALKAIAVNDEICKSIAETGGIDITTGKCSKVVKTDVLKFCATGKGGFSRNLQRHEIIEQMKHLEAEAFIALPGEKMEELLEIHWFLFQEVMEQWRSCWRC